MSKQKTDKNKIARKKTNTTKVNKKIDITKVSKKNVDNIYFVPHTHYDAIWVFTKEDYYYLNIDIILKRVIDLMEKDKDYKFMIEQTYLIEELEDRYPELFKKFTKYVKAGRMEIADGEYLMADTMLPQGETLIREIIFGKQYIKEKFDMDIEVLWQADSFGLNAQLPQIYRKCGYKYLAFRRGSPEKNPSEFIWHGLDNTGILSHFMPMGYRAGLNLKKLDESYNNLKEAAATNHILMPSGSGVTQPQENTSKVVKDWNKNHESKMKITTTLEFFKVLEKHSKKLSARKGEMFSGKYSEVFPDVASSRIWIKRSLRKYENELLAFEKFSAINSISDGSCPGELRECWKKVLFFAFHDVSPGTGMDEGYDEAKQHIGFLDTKLTHLNMSALKSIIDWDKPKKRNDEISGDVVVFNSLSWEVSNWVEVEIDFDQGKVFKVEGLKNGVEETEVEVMKFTRYWDESLKSVKLGFVANVPATGYKIYKIVEKLSKCKTISGINISGNTIKTKFFELKFSPDTGLIEVFKGGKKICKGNDLIIDSEVGDLYYHRELIKTPIRTESGEGVKYGSFNVTNFWIKKSPLRRIINIETDYYSLRWPYRLADKLKPLIWRHKFMEFKKKIIIYRDLPRIDFITAVDNRHSGIRLRVRFDTDIDKPEYTCDTQFGAVSRKKDLHYMKVKDWVENPSGIFPSIGWVDYNDGKKGLSILNEGNPENEVRDNSIYITLLRSVELLSDGGAGPSIPVPDAREIKKYTFKYSLYPHDGDWKQAKSYKQGYEFNYKLTAFQLPKNEKYRNKQSFLKVEPDNVIVSAVKKAEDGKDIIIRFYEAGGKKTKTSITLFKKAKSVKVVNLVEEFDKEFDKKLVINGNKIKLDVNPFEIITLKVKI